MTTTFINLNIFFLYLQYYLNDAFGLKTLDSRKAIDIYVIPGVQSVPIDTKLCDNVCQSLAAVWWFSPVSTNKTDRSDITDML
jgi:hypothetical protein